MDSNYLQKTFGNTLIECLTDVCLKKPLDPIEYIALWLYKHDTKLKQEAEDELERLERERKKREKQLEKERLERLLMEKLRFEEEEKERLLHEAEQEYLRRQEEEVQRMKEVAKRGSAQEFHEIDSEEFHIEIGINVYEGRRQLGSQIDENDAEVDEMM